MLNVDVLSMLNIDVLSMPQLWWVVRANSKATRGRAADLE